MSSTTLFRLSGLALILGALLSVVSVLVTGDATGMDQYNNPLFLPARLAQIVGGLLILIGLPGLYARQAERAGKLGFAGFVMTFLGIAAHWHVQPILSFVSSELAARPETRSLVVGQGGAEGLMGPLFIGYFAIGILVLNLGMILLGIATLRARVFPRWAAWLLIIGPPVVIAVLPMGLGPIVAIASIALFVLGFAWCGYALWAQKERPQASAAGKVGIPQSSA
jgi:hypothetical protein